MTGQNGARKPSSGDVPRRRFNVWKCSSLVLAMLLVVITGGGALREAEAKPPMDVLKALGMLEAAKRELLKTPKDETGHRTKAVDSTRAAQAELRVIVFGKDAAKLPFPK